jgi:UDP-GlcNAc:undecaprenyl-phosphate/decaprenyl-phosphate GlcNAc-1-phosphate transferase
MMGLFFGLVILNCLLFINLKKLSNFINIFDKPDNKLKKHTATVPLLGGTVLVINFSLITLFIFIFDYKFPYKEIFLKEYISIFFFIFSFFTLGIIDDKYKLKPEKKFFFSILLSIIVLTLNKDLIISDVKFSFYENRLFFNNYSFFFTIFCIIILINALNFYDGINGQSILFFLITFSLIAYNSPIYFFYVLIILVLIFLLLLNLRGKIFMGDNGIYFLGSILIISLIYEYNIFKSIEYADQIFLLLMVPGYDLLRLTSARIYRGKNAFYGDRNHIHHLLINRFSLSKTNIILTLLAILPILLFSFIGINFFIVLTIFTFIYFILILKLS